jgi:hypothetical protein
VTIQAQQLPVAAVGRIVVVVVILVVDGKLAKPLSFEFASASSTHGWKQFERLFAIAFHPLLFFAAKLSNELTVAIA